jgi:small conductance mechanosensitive channel
MITNSIFVAFSRVLVLAQSAGAQPGSTPAATQAKTKWDWDHFAQKSGELLTEYGMRVVGALVFLVVAWVVSNYLVRLTIAALTRAHVEITLAKFLSTLLRWGLLALVIITCLGMFGVPATSFVAVMGTVGLAIGLALQGSLSHMAAGVMLMLFRPFRVGDMVVIAGQRGTVDEIELFTTRLDTPDYRRVIIPNGQVYNNIIENITFHADRRIEVGLSLPYGADIEESRRFLAAAAKDVPGALAQPKPDVILNGLTATTVDWLVVVWAKAADAVEVRQALLRRIKEAREAAGHAPAPAQFVIHAGNGLTGLLEPKAAPTEAARS